MERIKTGSCAFFESIEGFVPSDYDYVEFSSKRKKEHPLCHIRQGKTSIFIWADLPKEELMQYVIEKQPASTLCLFLLPEVIEHLGITIDDLKSLQEFAKKLDLKHKYLGMILDSYIANNNFTLTEEQLQTAYAEYCDSRRVRYITKEQ